MRGREMSRTGGLRGGMDLGSVGTLVWRDDAGIVAGQGIRAISRFRPLCRTLLSSIGTYTDLRRDHDAGSASGQRLEDLIRLWLEPGVTC